MLPIASTDDKQAYAKLGGAIDNLSDSYTYVAKFLSIADNLREPLTNSGRMAAYLKATGLAQKAYSYARKVQDVLDQKKREGGLLKLGIKISLDIAGKLLGTSLTTHPYYAYHKAQIDALADALNANRNSRAAVEAYNRAVKAANSEALAAEFKRVESKKVAIVAKHSAFKDRLGVAADVARGMMSDDFARKKIAEYGGSARLFEPIADLETWRAYWSGLSFDVMQLHIMAGEELNVAMEAMNKAKDLVATLMGGNNTNRVAGYAATNNMEWEKYDQIVGQGKSDLSVMDPVRFAQGNIDKAAAWAAEIADMCDFVRSSEVIFSSNFNRQLDKLNRVLYG